MLLRYKVFFLPLVLFLVLLGFGRAEAAGIKLYDDGKIYFKVGGQLQLQWYWMEPDTGSPTDKSDDETHFRRLRPNVEFSPHPDWVLKGEVDVSEMRWSIGGGEWEMGDSKTSNKVTVQNAYIQYKGIKGVKVTLGNTDFNFSRELITSSKRQQLVERSFVGDHNYGVPDKNPGLHISGAVLGEKVVFGVSGAAASLDPDDDKIDMDNPINRHSDFNDGYAVGGRIEFQPLGTVPLAQGDLKRGEPRFAVGAGGFFWKNEEDDNPRTSDAGADLSGGSKPDVDNVTGMEVAASVRGMGVSVDGQYNHFWAETIDPTVTSGLYVAGEAEFENFSVEGGVMVWPERFEVVGGFDIQDSDTYAKAWRRTSFGANLFVKGHDTKIQATYRISENVGGTYQNDLDEFFLQGQIVF